MTAMIARQQNPAAIVVTCPARLNHTGFQFLLTGFSPVLYTPIVFELLKALIIVFGRSHI